MAGCLVAAYLLLLLALNSGACQRWMGREAGRVLSEVLKAPVSVDDVAIGLLNQVTLHGVVLNDPQGSEVMRGEYVSAKINLWPLLWERRVELRSVALLDTDVELRRKADGTLNIKYLIDAFSNPADTTPSHIDVKAGVVIMRRCSVAYADEMKDRRVGLKDIDLNVQLRHLTNDSLALRVRHCALREDGGLRVKHLSFVIEADRRGGNLRDFELDLPQSALRVPQLYASCEDIGQPFEDVLATLNVRPFTMTASVSPTDVALLLPEKIRTAVADNVGVTDVSAQAELARERLKVTALKVDSRDGLLTVDASGEARITREGLHDGFAKVRQASADLSRVADLYAALTGKKLPEAVAALQKTTLTGEAYCTSPERVQASFTMATAAGQAVATVERKDKVVTGHLTSHDFNPSLLVKGKDIPDFIDFDANGSITTDGKNMAGAASVKRVRWRGTDYTGLNANGTLNGDDFTLHLTADNAAMGLSLEAEGDKGLNAAVVKADVAHWTAFLPADIKGVSGTVEADVKNFLTNHPTGTVKLNDVDVVAFVDDTLTTHHLEYFAAESVKTDGGVNIRLDSDFMRGTWSGPLDIPAIKTAALNLVHRQLPDVVGTKGGDAVGGRWAFAVNIWDSRLLESLLHIPVGVNAPLSLNGFLDGDGEHASLQVDAPRISVAGKDLERMKVYASCAPEGGKALVQVQKGAGNNHMAVNLEAALKDGRVLTNLNWREPTENHYYGEVATETTFGRTAEGRRTVETALCPTDFVVNDTMWHVAGGRLRYADGRLDVSNCEVSQGVMQHARIDGCYSKQESDSIVAHLKGIDVKYILDIVNFHAVDFDGKADGEAVVKMEEGKPRVDFNLLLPHFYFNKTDMGETSILGNFDARSRRINLNARMDENGQGNTLANGYVSIAEKGLDLHFQAYRTPIAFLNRFVSGILDDVQGRATGNFHLYGGFKQLEFGGEVMADAALTIPVTGVRYDITTAKVTFTPGLIAFTDGHFVDGKGGTGIVEGTLRHEHVKNLRYHFEADVNDAYVYDIPQQIDWSFFSTARGNGHVVLDGRPGRLQTDINFTPTRGTDFTFINDTPETVSDGQYVRFGSKHHQLAERVVTDTVKVAPAEETKMDIFLNFNINVTPDAALHIIMDEKCGDVINLYGQGNVTATWYNKGDFRMYGTCAVDHGEYRFSIQDVIRKNFQLKQGGEVVFAGNPMDANLDVQAIYTVNSASLADLNAGTSFSDNTVRVNCLLNIRGRAGAPEISFDLDLPNVNEDEKQMVRKLIATEEDMNMQIIYLLGVGRFYTYDAASQSENGINQLAANSVNSFISNTLSSQLNEIISNALKTNNWSLGANLATGNQGWNDMEVEALLSGRLFNNRLLLNGQFGYRDKATLATSTNFIGDFDIQYLLTKNGNVRLKAYSETNDRYFTKSALTTQGIGIMLQRDFGRLEDKVKKRKQAQSRTTKNKKEKTNL